MERIALRIPELKLFKPRIYLDERGYFLESYRKPLYEELGLPPFVQDNVSYSHKHVIRGLHFQLAPGQAKLVRCERGTIFDVAVDIRPESPTCGAWEAVILDGETHAQLFIPAGFAHGFCVLSDTALVHYKVSSLYDPKTERGVRWNDPDLDIRWPISEQQQRPILSEKDRNSPFFKEIVYANLGHGR